MQLESMPTLLAKMAIYFCKIMVKYGFFGLESHCNMNMISSLQKRKTFCTKQLKMHAVLLFTYITN